MRRATAIRHVAFEDLGTLGPALGRAGYQVQYLEAGVDDLHAASAADLVIVLGGPIGALDDRHYPWLEAETSLLAQRIAGQRATLGICLGAQLMARALGARVYAGREREIGYAALVLTAAGLASPLRHVDGALAQVLHWHGDTFDLPQDCALLASTPACPHQAFARGRRVLALQCHPEVESGTLERWLIGHAVELGSTGVAPATLRAQALAQGPRLERQAALLWDEWLAGLAA